MKNIIIKFIKRKFFIEDMKKAYYAGGNIKKNGVIMGLNQLIRTLKIGTDNITYNVKYNIRKFQVKRISKILINKNKLEVYVHFLNINPGYYQY